MEKVQGEWNIIQENRMNQFRQKQRLFWYVVYCLGFQSLFQAKHYVRLAPRPPFVRLNFEQSIAGFIPHTYDILFYRFSYCVHMTYCCRFTGNI